jgi:hypothetical protein
MVKRAGKWVLLKRLASAIKARKYASALNIHVKH